MAVAVTSGEHAGLDLLDYFVETLNLLLRREVVVLSLCGVWIEFFCGGHCWWWF